MSIAKVERSITSGNENTVSQTFFRDKYININSNPTTPFNFEVPLFRIDGATYKYYAQTTDFISTNLNNTKSSTYYYTGNSFSLSGTNTVNYDIYRLDYATFQTVKDKIDNGTATQSDLDLVQEKLSTPFYTTYEQASAITSTAHTVVLPAEIKIPGKYKELFFHDKYQYFINTIFGFDRPVDLTLGEKYQPVSETGTFRLLSASTASTETLRTITTPSIITAQTFSGLSSNGAFFVYFTAPNKPNINILDGQPAVINNLNTFSPIFAFNGTEDGDGYKLQVSYDATNQNFTGTSITTFDIPKQDGDPEYIRTYSIALNPNSNFIYRIGNMKALENIFGVRHSVTTWSSFATARTVTDGTFNLSGDVYFHYVDNTTILPSASITLTLLSSFSNVDLEADTKYDSAIGSSVSRGIDSLIGTIYATTTDSNGYFCFNSLVGGNYRLTASNPAWDIQESSFDVTLTQNTMTEVVLSILWGNTIKTFDELGFLTFMK